MSITIELDKMTTIEKVRIMEYLWDDLCKHSDKVPSPSWHEEALTRREEAVRNGKEKFNDWHVEKEKIRQSLK